MSTYVIGDVHGRAEKLEAMMDQIQPETTDHIIFVGDIIDRGEYGIEIIKWIMEYQDCITMLMGNHEMMMLSYYLTKDPEIKAEILENWIYNGGDVTKAAFDRETPEMQKKIIEFLQKRPIQAEVDIDGKKFHIVHGFPCKDAYDAVWHRPTINEGVPFDDGRTVIIGHTPTPFLVAEAKGIDIDNVNCEQRIFHASHFIDIDCGAAYAGYIPGTQLACLCLDDMSEYYA